MALSYSLFALFCTNWSFQVNLRVEKDFWNYWLHIYSMKNSTCTKKGRSKSVFQGGKGCKTSSGTHLAGADGHSTNKYCLAHQNTFLHHPHTNFSKCWLFLEKRSQLWWEAGTGKKSSRKMACTFKELGSAIFFLIKPKSETKILLYCRK